MKKFSVCTVSDSTDGELKGKDYLPLLSCSWILENSGVLLLRGHSCADGSILLKRKPIQ